MAVSSSEWERYALEIEKLVREKTEGPLFDRKQELYSLAQDERKGELIRHFIALANAARRRGDNAFLVFGAKDDSWDLVGLDGQHVFPDRPGITLDEIEHDPGKLGKWHDEIERDYLHTIENWVEPADLPWAQFECGTLDGKLVACLVIPPERSELPYCVRRPAGRKQRAKLTEMKLEPRQCWRRVGANSESISPDSPVMRYTWRTLPFIPKSGWLAYLRQMISAFGDREPEKVDRYQALRARTKGTTEDLSELLRTFARAGQARPAVLILVGPPGGGKTTALRRLAFDLAETALVDMERPAAEYVLGRIRAPDQPTEIIPVFVSLRQFDVARQEVAQRFVQALTTHGGSQMRLDHHDLDCKPVDVLSDREIQFLVILDGLDEIVNWELSVQAIEDFLCRYPGARFIISTRTAYEPAWREERIPHQLVLVEPFSLQQQVRLYLDQSSWLAWLEKKNLLHDLEILLTNPRKLAVLDSRIPPDPDKCNLGLALEALLEGFLDEEQRRSDGPDMQALRDQWQKSLQNLAYQLCVQSRTWLSRQRTDELMGDEDLRLWGERVGLLNRSGNRICFVADVVRSYYAACRIKCMLEDEQDIAALLTGIGDQSALWLEPIHIAANLWPDDLTDEPIVELIESIAERDPCLVAQCLSERQASAGKMDLAEKVCRILVMSVGQDQLSREAVKQFLTDRDRRFQRLTVDILVELGIDCLNQDLERIAEQLQQEGDPGELEPIVAALEKLGSPRAPEFRTDLESRMTEPLVEAPSTEEQPDEGLTEEEIKSRILDEEVFHE